MNGWENEKIKEMLGRDIPRINNECAEIKRTIEKNLADTIDYLNLLFAQIPQSVSGPLITKTPKVKRSRVQRIETIPENEAVEADYTMSNSIGMSMGSAMEEADGQPAGRAKRKASVKAINSMREQQSITLSTKLRRPTEVPDLYSKGKRKRESKVKRETVAVPSSDEESGSLPRKQSRRDDGASKDATTEKLLTPKLEENGNSGDDTLKSSGKASSLSLRNSKTRSSTRSQDGGIKRSKVMDDTMIAPMGEAEVEEPSMYEDALAKPTPIMNSTMNLTSAAVIQKMMNATVVLEALPVSKLNETVTLKKQSLKASSGPDRRSQRRTGSVGAARSPRPSAAGSPTRKALQDRMQQLKAAMANKEFDDLITDDESSPEFKKRKAALKTQEERKRLRQRRRKISTSDDDDIDEVMNTPAKKPLREVNTALQEPKTAYKTNALFSPYAKESVKKRVEAFEQAGMNSPTQTADQDVPTRITRTKTRAIAAAKGVATAETGKEAEKTVAQKLARKSLARAKKISLARQTKDTDEYKENATQSAQKINKLIPVEKVKQKTTPLGKTKMLPPMSVGRVPQTPSNQALNNHTRALSAVRGNVVSNMESFIQPPKIVTKPASVDKMEERRRKMHEEDARRKREEALRLQTEEKRRKRQEKELKNKLAREAKERQELEKRQKAEREKEEKERLAQQLKEKQREELEKKRLLQMQRTQEKEERRKLEEQLRLQRLQEQEEAERLLAEQRRREQEAEKRREAEARGQQQVAAEATRLKNQMMQAQAKHAHNKHHGPTNYVLDSEPDDGESDDESRPKHAIPHWAQLHVRKGHLMMQRYIPEKAVFKFFDTRKCTPDLTELFQGIDRRKLKRTSSAVWKTPPRYSMMNLPE